MSITFPLQSRRVVGGAHTSVMARSANWLTRAGATVRTALEAAAQARAQCHLYEFANQCEALQPELAKELRAAALRGAGF